MPSYGGSLAAVRCLGENGVRVTVAAEQLLAAACWSRHAGRIVRCPSVAETARFVDWLLAFGEREPGHVLYASSDDMAYLFAANARELEKRFLLYQTPVTSLARVLDKKLLHEACTSVGLDTPMTWFPTSEDDLDKLGREITFTILIKARTQVLRTTQTKGGVVESRGDLRAAYRSFVAEDRYLPGLEPHFARDVTKPMLQRYFPKGAESVFSVTGFIDRSGEMFAARAAVKVFQRTRPVGLGLCFEAAPLDPALAAGVARLCREVGHFGVFEVEFVREGGRSMVIDFNPRFYGQMGFDTARGLPLAFLTWLGATGDEARLREGIADSVLADGAGAQIYTHRFIFALLLLAQRLGGSMSGAERDHWRRWYTEHRHRAVDASADPSDPWPGVVHAAAELWPGVRALGRVLREHSQADAIPESAS